MIFYFWYQMVAMDQLKQIEAFVNSAMRGSLSAAARLEGVTPAVIGRRLDALEARLGVKLLLRTTRKVQTTPDGQVLYERSKDLLAQMDDVENLFRHKCFLCQEFDGIRVENCIAQCWEQPCVDTMICGN